MNSNTFLVLVVTKKEFKLSTTFIILGWQSSKKFQFGSVIRSKHLINEFSFNNYKNVNDSSKRKVKFLIFGLINFCISLIRFLRGVPKSFWAFEKIVLYFKMVLLKKIGIKAKVRICKFDKIWRNPLRLANISISFFPILVFLIKKKKKSNIL